MGELAFSPKASADVEEIAAFSREKFGRQVAAAYVDGLDRRCEQLREYPRMGAIYPRLRHEILCLTYRSYRIFYRIDDDHILIVRILHHSRDERQMIG